MAERPIFISNINKEEFVEIKNLKFEWFPGFSVKQKQKSIESLHMSFLRDNPDTKILEISSKSPTELGVALSAFNLMIRTKNDKEFSVESAFQSSKVFEKGGPYVDLIESTSRIAKRDPRLKTSGNLVRFQYFNRTWPLEPKTLFYDWLYINALAINKSLSEEIVKYDAFTDIEFNPGKSINCQAKAAALYVSLNKLNLLDYVLTSTENYIQILSKSDKNKKINPDQQLGLFD
ncbi:MULTISPECIES: DarT1-associated NADAR antitoxin family protein [Bacillaceae]|uniref:DarT1-associated NADAR antitoxin family protein n=1 Tax=Bacillaceae TaxID=186817 RepID=UPI002964B597|nr:hypothetical protein [Bacillus infantis]MDW2878160.1 hypothetical protein [Bacillus infantis]